MIPDPLHPAVVHFPLVFATLLPLVAGAALLVLRRPDVLARRVWLIPVGLSMVLTFSAWAALATGETDGERAEAVVGEALIAQHEHAAERLLVLSLVVGVVLAAGLARGGVGRAARLVGTAGTLAVLISAVQVGAAGGELVYRHGAAGLPGTTEALTPRTGGSSESAPSGIEAVPAPDRRRDDDEGHESGRREHRDRREH